MGEVLPELSGRFAFAAHFRSENPYVSSAIDQGSVCNGQK
jgi:hypothetical protein